MPRAKNKEERSHSSTAEAAKPINEFSDEPTRESERIRDVLVRVNYALLFGTLAAVAICVAVAYFVHSYQIQKNASRLRELADAAEADGEPRAAITHLTRYLALLQDQFGASPDSDEQTETLAKLADLLAEHADSGSDLIRAYDYYEQILRNDPTRHEARRELIDVCMKIGRSRDAIQHLTRLYEKVPASEKDPALLLQEAHAHVRLREYAEAQLSYCRLIAANPARCDSYLALARLVTSQPSSLWRPDEDIEKVQQHFSDEVPPVVHAFPPKTDATQAGSRQRAALKTADAILQELTLKGKPATEALRGRAIFLASLRPGMDEPPQEHSDAQTRSQRMMAEFDEDADGVLSSVEAQAPAIPPFADINHDHQIDPEELTETLTRGSQFRRLEEAESALGEAMSLAHESGQREDQLKVHRAAVEIFLALADAWEYPDYERAKEYVARAKEAVEQAERLSDDSPESLLAQARLQLAVMRFETEASSRQKRLNEAEKLLSDARAKLVSADEESANLPQESQALQVDVDSTLGDVLVSRMPSAPPQERSNLIRSVRQKVLPSLEEFAAPEYWIHFLKGEVLFNEKKWREAEAEYQAAAAHPGASADFLRRVGLRRARCAQKLADTELHVARTLSVHQSDSSWAGGRIELAEAYRAAGNVEAALAEFRRYANHPDITPVVVRLLIQREEQKPFAERDWGAAEQALDALKKQDQNAAQVPLLQSNLLLAQAFTEQAVHQAAQKAGVSESAEEKFQQAEDVLRNAVDEYPEDVNIRRELANLTVIRFDLPVEERVRRCENILQLAREQLGDSVELRLANANATRLLSDDDALAALQELHRENADFTPQDRANLLSGLVPLYVGRGQREKAINALVEAATLVDTEIVYPQAALGQIILHVFESDGEIGDQEENWDELLAALAEIEGDQGPLAAYYRGALVVMSAPAELVGLNDNEFRARLDQAESWLRFARRERPKWNAVPRMLGELELVRYGKAQQQGSGDALRFQEAAVAHFEAAVELDDLSEVVVGRLVEFYLQQHREQDAQQLLNLVARKRPQALSGKLATLAWAVETQLKEQNLAIDEYIEQAGRSGQGAAAKIRAALMRMTRGDFGPEVETLLLEACELEPQSPGPWEWIVRYYAERDRSLAAQDQIDEAEQALPDEPAYLKPRTIARCYRTLRRWDADNRKQWEQQTEQHYLEAIEADPQNIDLKRELTEFYTESSQLDAARRTLASILAPQSGASPQARDWAVTHQALLAEDPAAGLARLQEAKPVDERGRIDNLRAQLVYFMTLNRVADRPAMLAALQELHQLTRGNLTARERFQLTSIHQANGDWQAAHDAYEEWLERDPRNTIALAQFASSLLRHADEVSSAVSRARTHWETLRDIEPHTYRTHALEARLLAAEEQPEMAAEQLSTFVLDFADVTVEDVFVNLQEQTSAEQAISLVQSAEHLTADPTVAAELKKAQDLLSAGESDQALKVLQRLSGAERSVANLRIASIRNAAELVESFGQFQIAEKLYTEYSRRSPEPEARLELARFLGRQQRFGEALQICREHWDKISPDAVGSLTAALLRAQPTPDSAAISEFAAKLKATIDSAPDDSSQRNRLFELANLYDIEQNNDAAEATYSQIIQIKPDDVASANNLAFIWARRKKNLPQALELINDQLAAIGQSAELLDTKAVVLIAAGKAAEAVNILKTISEQIPAPMYFLHLAEAQAGAGLADDAKQSLQTAIDKGLAVEALHPFDLAAYRKLESNVGGK